MDRSDVIDILIGARSGTERKLGRLGTGMSERGGLGSGAQIDKIGIPISLMFPGLQLETLVKLRLQSGSNIDNIKMLVG